MADTPARRHHAGAGIPAVSDAAGRRSGPGACKKAAVNATGAGSLPRCRVPRQARRRPFRPRPERPFPAAPPAGRSRPGSCARPASSGRPRPRAKGAAGFLSRAAPTGARRRLAAMQGRSAPRPGRGGCGDHAAHSRKRRSRHARVGEPSRRGVRRGAARARGSTGRHAAQVPAVDGRHQGRRNTLRHSGLPCGTKEAGPRHTREAAKEPAPGPIFGVKIFIESAARLGIWTLCWKRSS